MKTYKDTICHCFRSHNIQVIVTVYRLDLFCKPDENINKVTMLHVGEKVLT